MGLTRICLALATAALIATPVGAAPPDSGAASTAPTLTGAASRKVHGAAGPFDLPLPATESRAADAAGVHALVFTFDVPVNAGTATVTEGIATAGTPVFAGNEMIVPLTGVANAQHVTVAVAAVASPGRAAGGTGAVRVAYLLGDVNGNGNVTVADLMAANAALSQPVSAANYLDDVDLSGTVTVADKIIVNANLARSLLDVVVASVALPRSTEATGTGTAPVRGRSPGKP